MLKKKLNSSLAKYLFDKEILYKNSFFQLVEKEMEEDKSLVVQKIENPIKSEIEPKREVLVEKNQPSFVLKHKVLVFVNTISADEKILLTKIMNAVGLSLDQIDLVELDKLKKADYQSFLAQKVASKVISFGVGFSKIGIDLVVAPYEAKNLDNVVFLLADELKSISESQILKKNLWSVLQKIFV